jgi:methyl-accepting chemotaxis protein
MRVNICYSVELDEIPEVVNGLLREVSQRLINVSEVALDQEQYLRDGDSIAHAQHIAGSVETVRAKLTDIDRRLNDLMSIYAGYYQAKTNPEETMERLNEVGESVKENAEQLQHAAAILEDVQQTLDEEVVLPEVAESAAETSEDESA